MKAVTELKRAEGPAGNSHAREGVVRDMNKLRAEGPALDLHVGSKFHVS
jgi:hypothetical protein